jgi:5-methylcytosine-specific restriction endonuclease McrA
MSGRSIFTKRIKLLAFQACGGRCPNCTARLGPGNLEFHHITECTYSGTGGIDNCIPLCKTCHKAITKERAPVIAKSNRVRAKHLGIARKRSSFATNKSGPLKRKMDGTIVRRNQPFATG